MIQRVPVAYSHEGNVDCELESELDLGSAIDATSFPELTCRTHEISFMAY